MERKNIGKQSVAESDIETNIIKEKLLDKVPTILIQKGSKIKLEVVKPPMDKLIHNKMLGKAMLLVGKFIQTFEVIGYQPTFEQRISQAPYFSFYKFNYENQSFCQLEIFACALKFLQPKLASRYSFASFATIICIQISKLLQIAN